MRTVGFGLLAPFLLGLAACDSPYSAPTGIVPATNPQSLLGNWEGTATFQSLSGAAILQPTDVASRRE